MKLLILSLAFVSFGALAAPKLCASNTKTILTCTSTDVLPMYPFVAICEDSQGLGIVLDPGAGRTPDAMNAVVSETETNVLYSATDEDADHTVLTYHKNATSKKNGTLSFTFGPINGNLSFNCK